MATKWRVEEWVVLVRRVVAVVLAAGVVVAGSPVWANPAETDHAAVVEQQVRDELAADGSADFWVVLRDRADLAGAAGVPNRAEQGQFVHRALTGEADASQAGLRAMLAAERVAHQPFWIANTVLVTGDAELVQRIAARPEVREIRADRVVELPEPDPGTVEAVVDAVEWNVDRVGAPRVWSQLGATGEGIVVGSIDSGVQFDHPALVRSYRGNDGDGGFDHNYNWFDPSRVCGDPSLVPCDNNGHGTHTMGTIVGDDGGDNRIGVAPGAKWMTAKGCESRTCTQAALLAAGQWILAPTDLQGNNPDPARRPHIVNNSWGSPAENGVYRDMVRAWEAAGILPVFANGNDGPGCATADSPATYPESYGVGAFDIDNRIALTSSRGPSALFASGVKPNIAAPGVNVRSSVPGNTYAPLSGTSMATPHVTGAVALLWSLSPSLERDLAATRILLDQTAIDVEDLQCGGSPENNHVWGQGRLDVFAAAGQAPCAGCGTLTGTVTDAASGEPITGATVSVTGPASQEQATGADGRYTFDLPVGDYSLTGSAFGYTDRTGQAAISAGQTTTVDLALVVLPAVTVTGRVTDGSGHGWPLYASVGVEGVPVRTFTSPVTGAYSLRLPANASHTLQITPQYPGYAVQTLTVDVGDSDVAVDVAATVDRCPVAPGYAFSDTIGILSNEPIGTARLVDFLGARSIPSRIIGLEDDPADFDTVIVDWWFPHPEPAVFQQFLADADAAGTGLVFLDSQGQGAGINLLSRLTGNPATRDQGFRRVDEPQFPYTYYQVTQEHPILAGFAVGEEIIFDQTSNQKLHAWFGGYEGEGRQVIANTGRADRGVQGAGIGVQERADNRHVLLAMHSPNNFVNPSFWTEDAGQIFLNALDWVAPDVPFECLVVDGGLAVGTVADRNTGAGLTQATVTNAAEPGAPATSIATPDDPALDDGFYWQFSPAGARQLTAAAGGYQADTRTVDVAADAATEANFSLAAGQLAITPAEVRRELRLGQTGQVSFTVRNTGTAAAELDLTTRAGSFQLLGEPAGAGTAPAPVREVHGSFPTGVITPDADLAGAGQPAAPSGTPAAAPWTGRASYPQSIADNSAAAVGGLVYSFGGFTTSFLPGDSYVYHPAEDRWRPIAPMPSARTKAESEVIDGEVYLVGGWATGGVPTSTVFVYDPAVDDYRQVASMPAGRTAPGVATLDGKLYVVGGCTSGSCAPHAQTVWRYDPATDAWQTLPDYPEPAAWLGCAGIDGRVICAGGVGHTEARAYDPDTNTWTRLADLPYDNWGMAAEAVNGQLVISGGGTNGITTITNRGAVYDPDSDAWTEIQPSNSVTLRGGSACGFYRVGGLIRTAPFIPTADVEQHPDFACQGVPWLEVSPPALTIQPGQQVRVVAGLDARVEQPGTYTASLRIRHDTPYQVDQMAVTMTVTPPSNWGKVAGLVTGVDCEGEAAPLPGAIVRLDGLQLGRTLRTNLDGRYAYWLGASNNPVQVIVDAPGHIPQVRTVRVVPRQTVSEDFVLTRICGSTVSPVRYG